MKNDFAALRRITEMALEAELAALRDLTRKREELLDEIDRLQASLQARSREIDHADTPDPCLLAGRDSAWQRWAAERQNALTARLTRLAATREEQMIRARRAFGRSWAVAELARDQD